MPLKKILDRFPSKKDKNSIPENLISLLLISMDVISENGELKEKLSTLESSNEAVSTPETDTQHRKANTDIQSAYDQLKQKEGQLVQKERWVSIGQLSAGIAHEINNPLGFVENNLFALQLYISKFSEMLSHYENFVEHLPKTEKTKEGIQQLQRKSELLKLSQAQADIDHLFTQCQDGINRMTTIIKSLKNFSQLENLPDQSSYNLNTAIANTLTISQNEYKYVADVNTQYGDIPDIECDASKINQVFLNIIINAAQALKDNKERGFIKISTYQDQDYIYCKIKDNGPGISEENIKKIFDPFFTTKDPGVGTGLGLSLSYDIIRKHGGDITVESEIGKGATFIIKLPVTHE